MSFEGVSINKLNGGLARTDDNADRGIVILCGAGATDALVHKQVYELVDIQNAEAYGITAASDANNDEQLHYHLSEMFRLAPDAVFHLIPIEKTTTVADLVGDVELLSAIRSVKGVNVIGIAGINSKSVDVINTDILALQGMVNELAKEHILIDGVFLEGKPKANDRNVFNFANDLYDLRTLDAPNVSVVVGQDPKQVALNAAYAGSTAVGTVLGSVAVRKVHEDLGSVDIEQKPSRRKGEESYSLTDTVQGRWLSATLSDGTPFEHLTGGQQKQLSRKGYIYVGSFAEYTGFYLSGCPTAVVKTSDYAYFNMNCIWNKAARIIRRTLIPKVRSNVPTEPSTGYIKSTWIASMEGLCLSKLEPMVSVGNADGIDVYINPKQVLSEDSPLQVKALVVVGQIVHEFSVDLGLTTKIQD
ncbi:MAG: hypothetical protein CSB03_00075 [Bacteroidia bacterium]|nr:MAG: hypothetical protein CSB03_00075 [Bacteroidia bacterium]